MSKPAEVPVRDESAPSHSEKLKLAAKIVTALSEMDQRGARGVLKVLSSHPQLTAGLSAVLRITRDLDPADAEAVLAMASRLVGSEGES